MPSAWFRAGETAELRTLALEAQRLEQQYAAAHAEFSAGFSDALLERKDLLELLALSELPLDANRRQSYFEIAAEA